MILRAAIATLLLACAACTPMPQSDLFMALTTYDVRVRLGASAGPPATFQFFQNGRGSAEFDEAPEFPLTFTWTLNGTRFCLSGQDTAQMRPYCAQIARAGDTLTFTDVKTGSVTTARLIPR